MSDSLRPHESQHTRPPYLSPTARIYPNPCPSSQWCHPTISSSVVPFFSCPQSFPASGSFQMSQLFASGGQSIGASASTSVLPMNTQDWSPLGWTGWISLQSKGLSRVFSDTTVQKHQFFGTQLSFSPTLKSIHDHWKNHSLDETDQDFRRMPIYGQTNTSSNAISTPAAVTFIPASYPLVKDREAWRAAIHGVSKESDMTEQLNNNKKTLGLAAWKDQLYLQMLVNATKQLRKRPGRGKDSRVFLKLSIVYFLSVWSTHSIVSIQLKMYECLVNIYLAPTLSQECSEH